MLLSFVPYDDQLDVTSVIILSSSVCTIEFYLNNLRVFAAKQITERRDDALLNEIGNLLFVAGNCQI